MSVITQLYPWQHAVWQQLNLRRGKTHHALLLHGRSGIGKYEFATHLSQAMLCSNITEDGHACKHCASCHWFAEESHPDFRMIAPEQEAASEDEAAITKKTRKKTQISIAQIRDLNDFIGLSSHQSSGLRVVLIHPAEALNPASANALLKMLEEPAPGVMFILIANHVQRLLPTILSRCQKVKMSVPTAEEALTWLKEQGVDDAAAKLAYHEGSPIQVFNEQGNFPQLAEIWRQLAQGRHLLPQSAAQIVTSESAEAGVIAIQKWIYDLASMKFYKQIRYHIQHQAALQALADKVNSSRLFEFQKKMSEMRKLTAHPLSQELQIESLLVEYTRIFQ